MSQELSYGLRKASQTVRALLQYCLPSQDSSGCYWALESTEASSSTGWSPLGSPPHRWRPVPDAEPMGPTIFGAFERKAKLFDDRVPDRGITPRFHARFYRVE